MHLSVQLLFHQDSTNITQVGVHDFDHRQPGRHPGF